MTVRLTAVWQGGYHVRTTARGFEVVVDEPPEAGGEDHGPMPTELFLASLATCFAASVAHAARKLDVVLPDLTVEADGSYTGLRFSALRLSVRSTLPRSQLEPLVERARNYCYVSNTLLTTPQLDVVIAD
jgi:putative redox protein